MGGVLVDPEVLLLGLPAASVLGRERGRSWAGAGCLDTLIPTLAFCSHIPISTLGTLLTLVYIGSSRFEVSLGVRYVSAECFSLLSLLG